MWVLPGRCAFFGAHSRFEKEDGYALGPTVVEHVRHDRPGVLS
jgi:hypothetical protein